MRIIFRDNTWLYYSNLDCIPVVNKEDDIDLDNIRHLDDAEAICHYIHNTGSIIPVYYECNDYDNTIALVKNNYNYMVILLTSSYIKDYTLVNLNLLNDGDSI